MAKGPKPRIIGDRQLIRYTTVVVSAIGLIISAYALYVEKRLQNGVNYKPLRDINGEVRCSKALSSEKEDLLSCCTKRWKFTMINSPRDRKNSSTFVITLSGYDITVMLHNHCNIKYYYNLISLLCLLGQ